MVISQFFCDTTRTQIGGLHHWLRPVVRVSPGSSPISGPELLAEIRRLFGTQGANHQSININLFCLRVSVHFLIVYFPSCTPTCLSPFIRKRYWRCLRWWGHGYKWPTRFWVLEARLEAPKRIKAPKARNYRSRRHTARSQGRDQCYCMYFGTSVAMEVRWLLERRSKEKCRPSSVTEWDQVRVYLLFFWITFLPCLDLI